VVATFGGMALFRPIWPVLPKLYFFGVFFVLTVALSIVCGHRHTGAAFNLPSLPSNRLLLTGSTIPAGVLICPGLANVNGGVGSRKNP